MKTLTIEKPSGFALQAAAEFYAGFIPGSGMAQATVGGLTLAFRLDKTFEAVAVDLREVGDELCADVTGSDDSAAVLRQVARMLGLDAAGDGWLALGRREPVVGKLQGEFPGFFTAAKPSPYDAATWGVLCPRTNIRAAAQLKMRISQKHGTQVRSATGVHHVFPEPEQLLAIEHFEGLPEVKLERLKGIARAALQGKLEVDRLRAMNESEALLDLQQLPGVGPWTASHILYRGAAPADGLPSAEPRVLHGLADAYGLDSATTETLQQLAENWRPFRTWVCILLARHLARVGGWNNPSLGRERAAAGRRVAKG